jgi:ATP-dependent helicase/nuclease subunit B
MLKICPIRTPKDQQAVFRSFDPSQATWLVSDLKSKLDLNRRLLEERTFLPGESVLRASELWKMLLSRLRPDLQIVSREFAITLTGQKLAKMELDWVQAPGAAQAAFDYLTQFMPVLAHPSGEEMMREWLEANPASAARWGRWFDLSLVLWQGFLEDGFLAPAWASGVLVNELAIREVWSRPLFVDLGAELDQVEADLLVQLAESIDIHVLRPDPEWAKEYPKTLVAYDIFERKLKVQKMSVDSEAPSAVGRVDYRKYTTMIAEVKDAVAQARKWLDADAGTIRASRIAIVAPDIEAYWPALSSYLEQEGIPSQKDLVRRLHGYPDIARFLANLRLRTGSFAETDIEISLFDSMGGKARVIGYDRFKTLYATLYSREDINRSQPIASHFAIELQPGDEVSRDEFVAWSLKQLPEETELQRVESLYKRLFAEAPQSMVLSVRRWLAYLEQLAAKVECRVRDGDPDGIACLNLTSADNSSSTHMIILGLTESNLKPKGGTSVLFSDIASLAYEFGFHLASDDQARLEFEARWVTENSERELVLSVPETDFNGGAQAPSWLWVRGARAAGVGAKLDLPSPTRWDELQRSGFDTIAAARGWTQVQKDYLERALAEDLGEAEPVPFAAHSVKALSPSAIEDYLDCPFVFAAKRLFGLSDVAELDLEVDPSRRGSLMHALFELLTIEPIRLDLSDAELGDVVEQARTKSHFEMADDRMWPSIKSRHVDLGRRFLAFEKEYRDLFPGTKTVARELDLAGGLRPSTGELIADRDEPGALPFVGRIDRVDRDRLGNLAIYDYKSSNSSASQFGAWLKNNRIQLLLYASAVEKGLTHLDASPVMAAFYYVARPLSRDTGFKVEDAEQELYELSDRRKRNRLTEQEKADLFAKGQELVKTAVDGILVGRFAPNPRNPDDCAKCQWSRVCRAPHLNS